jgi:hypothetical protein
MTCHRLVSGVALLLLAAMACPAPVSAASVQAKYCIIRGGGEGGSGYTGNCIFSDYQQCLQAAAGGGNCVENIDYHGEASASQSVPAPRTRHRRR